MKNSAGVAFPRIARRCAARLDRPQMDLGPHAFFIIAAYAATALILGALIWSSVAAAGRARRELDGLERERGR